MVTLNKTTYGAINEESREYSYIEAISKAAFFTLRFNK